MRKPKIYLETTLFNYFFDKDRDAHADTVKLFQKIARGDYEAFTSDAVTDELAQAPIPKNTMMLSLIDEYKIEVFQVNDEARKLAETYIAEKIIPKKSKTDAIHIAMATVNELNFIVSLNFRHIVHMKPKRFINTVNLSNGYRPIEIFTPMEVVENEKT